MQTCPQCGKENSGGSKFCVHCGAALAAAAPGPQPGQQTTNQPGFTQPGYQAAYRAPRAPFTGNLLDHPPFLIVFVAALGISIAQFLGMDLAPGSAGNWTSLFENVILKMLLAVVFCAAGLMGIAGCIGLWRFREWGRFFVTISAAAYGVAGLMTLIAGGMNKNGGVHVAAMVLWGILMMAIAGGIIFYLSTDEVRSRMQR
jgi:uncharacterized membrane protein (DUF2068 family)